MNPDRLELRDYVTIAPDKRIANLSKREKVKYMDSLLNRDDEKRGLLVSFYLSHSGRRINSRVYSPWGQRDGIATLTDPYAKPILLNHDTNGDVLGRFVGGTYEDLTDSAVHRFKRTQDFVSLQKAFDTRDWEKVSDMLHRARVLLDSSWGGLGRMHTQARIFSESAIERFIDERYLTFSGGFDTDQMVCSHCQNDWRVGEICNHPGKIIDGKPVVLLCGSYKVREGSVVTQPADDLSVVTGLDLLDGMDADALTVDPTTIYLTDSVYTFPKEDILGAKINDNTEEPEVDEATTDTEENTSEVDSSESTFSIDTASLAEIQEHLSDSSNVEQLIDSIQGQTLTEKNLLVRIHDSLHHQYDWEFKFSEDASGAIPRDIFRLHAEIHIASVADGWRDALVNGELDEYSATGEPTGEFHYKQSEETRTDAETEEAVEDSSQEQATEDSPTEESPITVDAIQEMIKRAIESHIGSTDKNESANESTARESEDSQSPEDQTVTTDATVDSQDELQQDYKNALLQIEDLQKKLAIVLDSYAKIQEKDFSQVENGDSLQVKYDWFEQLNSSTENPDPVPGVKPVENPSLIGSGDSQIAKFDSKLGSFEKTVIENYSNILQKHGQDFANSWYEANPAKYMPFGFHPKNFIESGD